MRVDGRERSKCQGESKYGSGRDGEGKGGSKGEKRKRAHNGIC
jgi:hypothetical protein